jgi:multiple sugar transport system permease protein
MSARTNSPLESPVSARPQPVLARTSVNARIFSEERIWRSLTLVVLFAGAIIMVMPFLWLVTSSLKAEQEIFLFPPKWIPNPAHFENEIAIVGAASFCAYGFARIDFPGRNFWFAIVLSTMMVPYFVLMVPQFVIFSRLGWIDSYLPLTVPFFFGGGAFNIFLLRQFFRTLPSELADAARIDGCSEFGIYSRIFMPLAKPALMTVAIFTFLNGWNDFIGPLLYISSPDRLTVSIGLATFRGVMRTRWDLLMAASTAMIVPVLILFFLAQRYFVEGIVLSGLKG